MTAASQAPGTDSTPAADVAVPAPSRRRPLILLAQLGLGVAVVAGWEAGSRAGVIDEFFFSSPGDIAQRVGQWLSSGEILSHLGVTLLEAALALVIGGLLGLGVGFLLARVRVLAAVLDPYIKVLNALPRVVLAPIFLLWFGLGIWSKVAFGVTLVFFIVFFNTYQGVRQVDRVLIDNARMLGAREGQLLRHVLLPSAMTWIFSSLHISVGFAIVGAVVGEYLGASEGVGYLISQAEGTFDTTGVFAGMVVLSVVVVVVDLLVNRIERALLRWQPGAHEQH
ncbi:ABC transporter permease [Saccharopolyspora erythraea]|uniref:ABC transporter permease n=1 Tax=Saccharopolyspora erythraea TaxID=1836 RepID=UPI001BAB3FA5|nr:ABC transporter permease [Saccharopolyspora erythraea]QUH03046.1 ABC transporter permease [Saccharopolyspora erythraea]